MKPTARQFRETRERIRRQTSELRSLVQGFMNDKGMTELWIETDNPLLGGISPVQMIRWGKGEKLLKMVKAWLDENKRP